jgi:predicted Zn-dependent protease
VTAETQAGPTGSLATALANAERLLATSPKLAAEQANEILAVVPQHPSALLLLAAARNRLGDGGGALEILEPIVRAHGDRAIVQYELGLALGALRRGEEAVAALRRAVTQKPDLGDAWRALADHLHAIGDTEAADEAYARHLRFSSQNPRLLEAGGALVEGRIAVAESLLRAYLKQFPTDVAAIRMLAEVAARLGRWIDAENLLTRCLELAPSFAAARQNHATILLRHGKAEAALSEIDRLLTQEPKNPGYRHLKASALARIGDFDASLAIFADVLFEYSGNAKSWMTYGHALKSAGRQDQSIAAYRRSIELAPSLGEAWWSLANMKTFRFTQADHAAIRSQLGREDLGVEDRYHFHFALGKALEDARDYAASFEQYAAGNRERRKVIRYDADDLANGVQRAKKLFTREFFASRRGFGSPAPDPIFIVGLPRAGSTLIEQILASHSSVEGTMELPDVITIARELEGPRKRGEPSRYPEALESMSAADFRALGERYLAQTRVQRREDRPHFIDKMPNNWMHVGLIHLMLPNAKIIDARRHPLGCCFSVFKQHFARGQHFGYDLVELGRYYRDYVELMAHVDAVLPGCVHRVIYERLVEDTETELRSLLAYCGLPFEASCLRFYENERAVRTASSEQVRQPIYREGLDHWRHFEPWLAPLKEALGSVLETWPDAPPF